MINDLNIEKPCLKFLDDKTVYARLRSQTKLQETTQISLDLNKQNEDQRNDTKELVINFNRSLQDILRLLINNKAIEKSNMYHVTGHLHIYKRFLAAPHRLYIFKSIITFFYIILPS